MPNEKRVRRGHPRFIQILPPPELPHENLAVAGGGGSDPGAREEKLIPVPMEKDLAPRKRHRGLESTSYTSHGDIFDMMQDCQGSVGPNSSRSSTETLGTGDSSLRIQEFGSRSEEQSEASHDTNATELIDLEGEEGNSELLNKKFRSKVWKDFTCKSVEGSIKATCKHCRAELVAGNKAGTSHLKYHLKACTVLGSSKRKRPGGTPKADIPKFEQEQSREDFARMIVCHNYPFSMAEHYYTRRFITRLQPFFKLGHRTSVTEDCRKLYDIERDKLYGIINQNTSRVSITSDLWTATEMSCYMSMTVHYIDAEWKLQKRIIGFVHIKGQHNGENVGRELVKRLYAWNLDRKLFSFVLDNSSVNNRVIEDIQAILLPKKVLRLNGYLFHVRCGAHILNLIVQDGLKSIQAVIKKVRDSVKYVKGSTLRKENFRFIANQVKAPNISLVADVPTRWNSTYSMLETAQKFREAFARLADCDSEYKHAPSDDDWKNVGIVTNCLKVFYDVTNRVSGTKYPTASLYFNDFCGIYLLLRNWEFSENSFVADMAKPMIEKFEKYWGITNKLLTFATILDPRYKLKSIEYYFGLLYGESEAGRKVEAIKKSFGELFDEYAGESTLSSPITSTPSNFEAEPNLVESSMSLSATRLGLSRFIHQSYSSQNKKSELEVYLDDPAHPEMDNASFDIIAWWKLHGPKYPIISLMARDILSVPASTVASESAFSLAGLIIDDNRCSLLPETVEALMCTQDWLRCAIPDESSMATEIILPAATLSPTTNHQVQIA